MLRQYWELRGRSYDSEWPGFSSLTNEHKHVLSSLLQDSEASFVLEAGCGSGRISGILEKSIGLDWSRSMILSCREKVKRPYVIADIRHLPFRNNSFDCILTCEVLQHIENIRQVVKEFERIANYVICLEHFENKKLDLNAHCFQHNYPEAFGAFQLKKYLKTRGKYRPAGAFLFRKEVVK